MFAIHNISRRFVKYLDLGYIVMTNFNEHLVSISPYVVKPIDSFKVKLVANENPLGCSAKAKEAINEKLNSLSDYPCIQSTKLKERLAEKLHVPDECIVVGNGSDEIFSFIASSIIKTGKQLITARTTFGQYAFATKLFGGTTIETDLIDGKFSIANILAEINDNTAWIAIANPNNPTGTYLNQSELKYLLENVPKHIIVLIDEAYIEYSMASDIANAISLLDNYENLIITRTFSKMYGLAGLRVGYGIAQPKVASFLNKLRSPYNCNSVGQAAALASLEDNEFVRRSLENNVMGKAQLTNALDSLGLKYHDTQGNFILIYLPTSGKIIAEELAKGGVLVRDASCFGVNNAIRVTIGKPEENNIFISEFTSALSMYANKLSV